MNIGMIIQIFIDLTQYREKKLVSLNGTFYKITFQFH